LYKPEEDVVVYAIDSVSTEKSRVGYILQ